jgi:hypothetical protein
VNKAFFARWVTLAFLGTVALNLPNASASANIVKDCGVCWSECSTFDTACSERGGHSNLCSCSLDGRDCYVGDCFIDR